MRGKDGRDGGGMEAFCPLGLATEAEAAVANEGGGSRGGSAEGEKT